MATIVGLILALALFGVMFFVIFKIINIDD